MTHANNDELHADLDTAFQDRHDDLADRADEQSDFVLDASSRGLVSSAVKLQLQRDSLADTLKDIALGAQMMLEPALQATGTFKQYAEEVLRVARAGLKEAQL